MKIKENPFPSQFVTQTMSTHEQPHKLLSRVAVLPIFIPDNLYQTGVNSSLRRMTLLAIVLGSACESLLNILVQAEYR